MRRTALRVATQGHVLTVTDFVRTLAVEGAIHAMDLSVALPDAFLPGPPFRQAAATMAALVPGQLPVGWGHEVLICKVTGRSELDERDRQSLSRLADSLSIRL